jgi:hypothetical protein
MVVVLQDLDFLLLGKPHLEDFSLLNNLFERCLFVDWTCLVFVLFFFEMQHTYYVFEPAVIQEETHTHTQMLVYTAILDPSYHSQESLLTSCGGRRSATPPTAVHPHRGGSSNVRFIKLSAQTTAFGACGSGFRPSESSAAELIVMKDATSGSYPVMHHPVASSAAEPWRPLGACSAYRCGTVPGTCMRW